MASVVIVPLDGLDRLVVQMSTNAILTPVFMEHVP